jgi:hypothetical protein
MPCRSQEENVLFKTSWLKHFRGGVFFSLPLCGFVQQPLHAAAGGPALAFARFCWFCLAAHTRRLKETCHVGQKHALRHVSYRRVRHVTANEPRD